MLQGNTLFDEQVVPLSEAADVQCSICKLLEEAVRTKPEELLANFCDRLTWDVCDVCEIHLVEFRMMVEDDHRTDAFVLTVGDVVERRRELLPLAA